MTVQGSKTLKHMIQMIRDIDPDFSKEQENAIISAYEGNINKIKSTPDFALSRSEVAFLINRSVDTVDYYCRKKVIHRITLGSSSRAVGISALSVSDATGMSMESIINAIRIFKDKKAA